MRSGFRAGEIQCVGRSFIDVGCAGDGERRRDVIHLHCDGVGRVGRNVVSGDRSDGEIIGAGGISVRDRRRIAGDGLGMAIAPGDEPGGDCVWAGFRAGEIEGVGCAFVHGRASGD